MSVELTTGIPFRIPAGTEVQETVTTEGLYSIHHEDVPAKILPANEQRYAYVIAVDFLQKNPKDETLSRYVRGYLSFPEKYRPKLMDILQKMERLNFDPKRTPTFKVRMELLTDAQDSIFELEQELPKEENRVNPVIYGLKIGFNEYINSPNFQAF